MFGQWMGDNRIDLELGNKEVSETFEDLKRNKEIIKNIDKDFFFEFGETILNLIQTQQEEIEKKDKQIDKMENYICAKSFDDIVKRLKDELSYDKCEIDIDDLDKMLLKLPAEKYIELYIKIKNHAEYHVLDKFEQEDNKC